MLLMNILLAIEFAALVQAELTCLEWGLVSPLVGIFCHFEPASFRTAKKESEDAVESAIASAKHLVEFDLTHNPVAVTYNLVEQSRQGGLEQGKAYLHNVTNDFRDVTVGFGKETANQIIQIYELTHWNEFSLCLINGAVQDAAASRRLSKRAQLMSTNKALMLAKQCTTNKLSRLSKPVVFNVTGPGQKVGSTISDLASMLSPIGAEGEIATGLSEEAVDLAIPGSESDTLVYDLVDDKGKHFTSIEKARVTAKRMEDADWVAKNCKLCRAPPPISIINARGYTKRWDLNAACCPAALAVRLPTFARLGPPPDSMDQLYNHGVADLNEAGETSDDLSSSVSLSDTFQPQGSPYLVTEAQLTAPVDYELHSIDQVGDIAKVLTDLDTYSTSLVQWNQQLSGIEQSAQIFKTLRQVFESDRATSALPDLYDVQQLGEWTPYQRLRYGSSMTSDRWLHSEAEQLQPLIRFAQAAIEQCIDTVGKLKSLSQEERGQLHGTVKFFYDPPYAPAMTRFDPRQMVSSSDVMQFVTTDTTGLIIERGDQHAYSALVPRQDAFHLLKGTRWQVDPVRPTRYAELGSEVARKGCLQMTVVIE